MFPSLSPYSLHWPDVHSDLPRVLLSDVLGISALVDALNNPSVGNATETTVLGPFFAEDTQDVPLGESIALEGKGDYIYIQGCILNLSGKPIPGTVIELWETDNKVCGTPHAQLPQ
ncbi:hypothetical protein BC827DRAFT_1279018 [Russula dissimulans]|nr:hypothetical protein BC827DRAFT_1279018 [Russula dissimulans]